MMKWPLRVAVSVVFLFAAGVGFSTAFVTADTIVQSFQASGSIQPGWVVAAKPGSPDTVELAPAGQSQLLYGVAIDPSQAPVTLQRQLGQQVFVATNGTYPVLVSTQNGTIKPGDYLSISNTNGIVDKATDTQTYVLGQALQKFDGTSGVFSTGTSNSTIGRISVNVLVQHNPWLKNSTILPSFLRSAGNSIAGKEVTALRLYAAAASFLIAGLIAFGTLAVGVRSSMISIGRNPLSRQFILRGLLQVVAVSFAVLIVGLISVYLLLKL
jgi:hypothetical protein